MIIDNVFDRIGEAKLSDKRRPTARRAVCRDLRSLLLPFVGEFGCFLSQSFHPRRKLLKRFQLVQSALLLQLQQLPDG